MPLAHVRFAANLAIHFATLSCNPSLVLIATA